MRAFTIYISVFLVGLMAAAIVLPAVHEFNHEHIENTQDVDHDDLQFEKTSIDCSLCDFSFSAAQQIVAYEYELHIPQKETVYSRSLAQTVHLFPNTLFSLRAPPALVFS